MHLFLTLCTHFLSRFMFANPFTNDFRFPSFPVAFQFGNSLWRSSSVICTLFWLTTSCYSHFVFNIHISKKSVSPQSRNQEYFFFSSCCIPLIFVSIICPISSFHLQTTFFDGIIILTSKVSSNLEDCPTFKLQ